MEEFPILNEFDEMIYISDINTYEILYMNKKCLELVGLKSGNYFGRKCYSLLQGNDSPCSFCTNSLLTTEHFHKWEFKNAYLKRHFSIKDKKIDWNGRDARIEFALDITEYKKSILDKEIKMSSIIRSIPGGICQVAADSSLKILWHNDNFLKLIGYTEEQFAAELHGSAGYVHPEDAPGVAAMMENVRKTGEQETMEMRLVRRDGKILTLITSMSYIDTPGYVPVYYSVGIDITEYKHQEEQSKEALRNALAAAQRANTSKSAFLSRMSHEIRTPLSAILGMSALAGSAPDNKDIVRDCHKKIDSAANYLLGLLNDILDMSRIESGKLVLAHQWFSFPEFLSGIINLFSLQAERAHVTFAAKAERLEKEAFYGDPLRLKQVVVNLLANAVKFTEAGGKVVLHVRELSHENNIVWLEISVIDTGIGMKAEFLKRIFRAFEQEDSNITSKYGGSGLGLAISGHLVELMGGNIEVRSVEGEGSRFDVRVPLTSHTHAPDALETACLSHLRAMRVLVFAEDEEHGNTAPIFQAMAVDAEYAFTEKQLEQSIRGAVKSGNGYDLVILDVDVPAVEMIDLIHAAREWSAPSKALIFAAVYNFSAAAMLSNDARVDGFIPKPLFRTTFLEAFYGIFQLREQKELPTAPVRDFSGKRILLVEDDELNREITREILKSCHLDVETATNGKEALRAFLSHPAGYFSSVLMDIRMPVMDGLTAAKEIRLSRREDAAAIPIIALSANAFEEDRQKSKDSGMNAHISKPVDIHTLCTTLARYLR